MFTFDIVINPFKTLRYMIELIEKVHRRFTNRLHRLRDLSYDCLKYWIWNVWIYVGFALICNGAIGMVWYGRV